MQSFNVSSDPEAPGTSATMLISTNADIYLLTYIKDQQGCAGQQYPILTEQM